MKIRLFALTIILILLAGLAFPAAVAGSTAASLNVGLTVRVSVASDGTQANQASSYSSITPDGRFVAFVSSATNLAGGATNAYSDIFVHDRQTGETTLVTFGNNGAEANHNSSMPSMSSDGRYIVLASSATNLVSDGIGGAGVFVHDRQTGLTNRADTHSNGKIGGGSSLGASSISGDGRYVAFASRDAQLIGDLNEFFNCTSNCDTNNEYDIFIHDQVTQQTIRVSVSSSGGEANGFSGSPVISRDGTAVVFSSLATNLVSGDTNGVNDIFVRDLQSGQNTRVSVASDGGQANGASTLPDISDDGNFILFKSSASNLVAGDTNTQADFFVHNRQTGQTERVTSNDPHGFWLNASISGDGRFVAFPDISKMYIYDRETGLTNLAVDMPFGTSASADSPDLSKDGKYLAFQSNATDIVPGDTNSRVDIFVHASGMVVNSTGDKSDTNLADGLCDTGQTILRSGAPEAECSLRAAIEQATDAANGQKSILFNIPNVTGIPVISPATPLPLLNGPLEEIDASTQAGGRVEINGGGTVSIGLKTDKKMVLRGLVVRAFKEAGITSGAAELSLVNLEVGDNCGWGVNAAGFVGIGRVNYLPVAAPFSTISHNGMGAGCQGGGLAAMGGVSVQGAEISNNGGPGILALGGAYLSNVQAEYNLGDGVYASIVEVVGDERLGADNRFSYNQGYGIFARATNGDFNGWSVKVQGIVEVRDNAQWGIYAAGEGHVGVDSRAASLAALHSHITGNGKGAACYEWFVDNTGFEFKGVGADCRGGGIFSAGGVAAFQSEIAHNGGPGILARDDVWAWGVQIQDNAGDGIQTTGAITMDPPQGLMLDNLVTGNLGHGLRAGLGGVVLNDHVIVSQNARWGVVSTGSDSVKVGTAGTGGFTTTAEIRDNGNAAQCWEWTTIDSTRGENVPDFEWITEPDKCRGGGVANAGGAVWLRHVEITGNGGPGVMAHSGVTAEDVVIAANRGDGILNQGGGVFLGTVTLHGYNEIRANQGQGIASLSDLIAQLPLWVLDNAGEGIELYSDAWIGLDGTGAMLNLASRVDGNGGGAECWLWEDWQTFAAVPCGGGGIRMNIDGVLSAWNLAVENNHGPGITSASSLQLTAGRVCGNQGPGISVGGKILLQQSQVCNNQTGILIHSPGQAAKGTSRLSPAADADPGLISGSQITGNSADGIRYEAGNSLAVHQSNFSANGGLAVNNLAAASLDATHNWWGAASGPGPVGPGTGDAVSANVDFANFRTSPVSLVVLVAPDPLLGASGTTVTTTVYVQNWTLLTDTVDIQVSDTLGWRTSPATAPVVLQNSPGASLEITFAIPAGTPPGTISLATVTATSQTTPALVATVTFQISNAATADVAIAQTSQPDPVRVGQTLTYTLTVTNSSPLTATGVSVTDILPAGVSLISAVSSQGTCSGTTTLVCAIGGLAQGAPVTITIQVLPGTAGIISNTAEVSANEWDASLANNHSVYALKVGENFWSFLPLIKR